MKTVYIALSLTHVRSEEERNEIRWFLKHFDQLLLEDFGCQRLHWAFDVDTWMPKPVENVYEFDTRLVEEADAVLFLYLSSDGSDGRGGELVTRARSGKPMAVLVRRGVKVSRYVLDCCKTYGIPPIFEFNELNGDAVMSTVFLAQRLAYHAHYSIFTEEIR